MYRYRGLSKTSTETRDDQWMYYYLSLQVLGWRSTSAVAVVSKAHKVANRSPCKKRDRQRWLACMSLQAFIAWWTSFLDSKDSSCIATTLVRWSIMIIFECILTVCFPKMRNTIKLRLQRTCTKAVPRLVPKSQECAEYAKIVTIFENSHIRGSVDKWTHRSCGGSARCLLAFQKAGIDDATAFISLSPFTATRRS